MTSTVKPPDYHVAAVKVAQQHGIPTKIFLALIHQESGGNPTAKSSAGAQGLTQLMPATARSLGVDPLNPMQNLQGGARYLKQQFDTFKNWRLALAAYNAGPGNVANGRWRQIPETVAYVRNILARAALNQQDLGTAAPKAPPPQGKVPRPVPQPGVPPPAPAGDPLFGTDLVAKTAFDNLGRIARGTTPTFTLPDLIAAGNQPVAPVAAPQPAPQPASPVPVSPAHSRASSVTAPYRAGRISIRAGANRAGTRIQQPVLDFVKQIAGVHGSEVTITTGTNHNQYVAGEGHTQSAHWLGWAVDLALNNNAPGHVSPEVTKMGQDALIAAGMPAAEARKQRGGLYNLNGYQIIFNSTVGGNHYNHVHVGLAPQRQHG